MASATRPRLYGNVEARFSAYNLGRVVDREKNRQCPYDFLGKGATNIPHKYSPTSIPPANK